MLVLNFYDILKSDVFAIFMGGQWIRYRARNSKNDRTMK